MEKQNKKPYIDFEIVKQLMSEKNIGEAELAGLIGVVPSTVKRYLTGKNQPQMIVLTAVKIAKTLGVNSAAILKKA